MRIKVDEDLPRAVSERLHSEGHNAPTVSDQELGGSQDDDLWEVVQEGHRFFITGDKGFADIRIHPPGQHHGVLLLRPDRDGIGPLVELLEMVLASTVFEDLAGAVAVATPRGLRIRR